MKTTPNELAFKILRHFNRLKGFDYWFDDLEPDIQDEIEENLTKLIEEELNE